MEASKECNRDLDTDIRSSVLYTLGSLQLRSACAMVMFFDASSLCECNPKSTRKQRV